MIDISKMTDEKKSVLLAQAMGWKADDNFFPPRIIEPERQAFVIRGSLYDPANMELAWRVLNWASGSDKPIDLESFDKLPLFLALDSWWNYPDLFIFQESPADAQRLWLDKILELVIDAELVGGK